MDDPGLAGEIVSALAAAGYDVDTVGDGDAALAAARTAQYDLMILDAVLPGTAGTPVCSVLRAENDLPIVVLAVEDGAAERIAGLDAGADDYISKPFFLPELVSRVRSQLRRRQLDRVSAIPVSSVGGLSIDRARHVASLHGRPLLLTRSEFRLVSLLASAPGRPCTREELIRNLWESDFVGDKRAIDVHISNLRRKLEDDPRRPRRLVTVRGVGYKLLAV